MISNDLEQINQELEFCTKIMSQFNEGDVAYKPLDVLLYASYYKGNEVVPRKEMKESDFRRLMLRLNVDFGALGPFTSAGDAVNALYRNITKYSSMTYQDISNITGIL